MLSSLNTKNMIKIAIIKPNHFNPEKFVQNDVPRQKLLEELKQIINVVEINPQDFISTILVSLELNEKEHGDTEILWEKKDLIYQMCFSYEKSGKPEQKDFNLMASFLSITHTIINGTAIFFCDKVNEEFVTREHENMDVDAVLKLFQNYFYHQGLIVTTENKIIPVIYDNENHLKYQDPEIGKLKLITENDQNVGTDGNILDFNFEVMIRNQNHDQLPVNKLLTKLVGLTVKGDGLIKQKVGTDRYDDLDVSLFKKLIKLSEFDVKTRLVKEAEVKEEKTKDAHHLLIIKNRYYVLKNRLIKFKFQCAECQKPLQNHFFICGGCKRLKYCNQDCQKKNWKNHQEECKKSQECFNCRVVKLLNAKSKEVDKNNHL